MRLNVITVHLRFENKINPPALPFGAPSAGTRINLPAVTAQCYNWLSCHYLDRRSGGLFITIPISWWLGHRSLPDIYELIKKKKKKRGRESQEVLSYWHSNSIPQKLSTRFSELLSQKTSELNKMNAPASRPTSSQPPVSPFRRKNNAFHFLKSRRKKKRLCCLYLFLSHKVTSTLLQDYINVPWRLKWRGVRWVCSTLFFFSFWRK